LAHRPPAIAFAKPALFSFYARISGTLISAWAHGKDINVSTLRTRAGEEVDFIVQVENQIFGIEVKHSQELSTEDLAGLQFFNRKFPKNHGLYVFHMGMKEQKLGKIWSLPW